MNLLLVSPSSAFLSTNQEFQDFWKSSTLTQSYRTNWSGIGAGLPIIAALTSDSHSVKIVDENVEAINFADDYDLVAITAMTQQITRAYEISRMFRSRGTRTVIGGIHSTLLPEEACLNADSVIIGEAEDTWPQVMGDFENGHLAPFYRSAGSIRLEESPLPRYDLLRDKGYKVIWIQTTRGCPHDCYFCAASKVFGKKYRRKTIEQVLTEIENVKSLFGECIRIGFSDDNLLVHRTQSKEFLKELIPMRIRYAAQTDISVANDETLLDLLRQSGCTFLFIGLESLKSDNLLSIDKKGWKHRKLKDYATAIQRIQMHGIGVMGSFIIGLPFDSQKSFSEICEFVIGENLYDAQIAISTPFPGTRLRETLTREYRILDTSWDNYTGFNVNFVHETLSKEQLERGILDIYRSINSKDAYIKKMTYFKDVQKRMFSDCSEEGQGPHQLT